LRCTATASPALFGCEVLGLVTSGEFCSTESILHWAIGNAANAASMDDPLIDLTSESLLKNCGVIVVSRNSIPFFPEEGRESPEVYKL
jgi:hypothetical protein